MSLKRNRAGYFFNTEDTALVRPATGNTAGFLNRSQRETTTFTPTVTTSQSEVSVVDHNNGSFGLLYSQNSSLQNGYPFIYGIGYVDTATSSNTNLKGNILSIIQLTSGGFTFYRVTVVDPGASRTCRLISTAYVSETDITKNLISGITVQIRIVNRNVFDLHFFQGVTVGVVPRAFNVLVACTP